MTQQYKYQYNTYPVLADDSTPGTSFEGAVKRFTPMPQPNDVYEYALLGLPKYFPLTRQPIPVSIATDALNSAIVEIEMESGMNISPSEKYHSEDYIDGMFTNNYMGIRLQQWPCTEIKQMQLKYAHTNTPHPYQTYTIPSHWIYLRRNRVNVVAALGSVTVQTDNSATVTAGGIFTFITGFNRGAYGPGSIEVVYTAGWQHDKLPSMVADLIKTWAAWRMLNDILPVLFPQSSVSVGIDGVQQSVAFNIVALLQARLAQLEQKKKEQMAAVRKNFGKTMRMGFIGA